MVLQVEFAGAGTVLLNGLENLSRVTKVSVDVMSRASKARQEDAVRCGTPVE